MRKKALLISGVIFLILGIVLKLSIEQQGLAIIFIAMGVLLKTVYIIRLARQGRYKVGKEIVILALGLILFFLGLYLRPLNDGIWSSILIIIGLSLKTTFVALFVRKLRKDK